MSSLKKPTEKSPLPRWLGWVVLTLLLFLPVSPFLVTVTKLRYLSLLRELLAVVILGYSVWWRRQNKHPIVVDDLERLIVWLMVFSLISLAFITHDPAAWAWSARYSLLPLAVFWGLHPFSVTDQEWCLGLKIWLAWSSVLIVFGILMITVIPRATLVGWGYSNTVAIGGGQWVGSAALPAYQSVGTGTPRLQATMSGPIQLAGYAVLMVYLALGLGSAWVGSRFVLALGALAIILTYSRSVWLAFVLIGIGLGLRALHRRGWGWGEIGTLLVITLVGLFAIGGLYVFQPNAEGLRYSLGSLLAHEGSDQQHAESLTQSVGSWREVGFFGIGFGRSGAGAIQNAAANPLAPLPRYVDNSYLRWWEELGLPGILLFTWFIWILIAELRRQPNPGRQLAIAGLVLTLAALLTDMWLEAAPVITFLALAALWHQPMSGTADSPSRLPLNTETLSAVRDRLAVWATGSKPHVIITLNPEMTVAARQNEELRRAISNADLVTADGAGLLAAVDVERQLNRLPWWLQALWAPGAWIVSGFKLLFAPGRLAPSRSIVTGSDLVPALLEVANQKKQRVALLGSTSEVIEAAKQRMGERWPDVKLVYAEAGPIFTDSRIPAAEGKKLASAVAATKADYLFVAFGVPRQEIFLSTWKETLGVPVMIGVSGAFDTVLAGRLRRSPRLLQALHLEWLWRLILQPSRANRIWTAIWRFPVTFTRDILAG